MVLDIADNDKTIFHRVKKTLKITDYLYSIKFLSTTDRDEAIKLLIDALDIEDKNRFNKAVLEREKIVSTGIGINVAIPHAKLSHITNFFIVVGIQREGIEWNSIDSSPVKLIFLIGGPDNKQNEYLQILSHLTAVIKDESVRKKLILAVSKQEVIDIFKN